MAFGVSKGVHYIRSITGAILPYYNNDVSNKRNNIIVIPLNNIVIHTFTPPHIAIIIS